MSKMSQTAIDKYLSTPNIAHLVTLKEDGSPHVSPIWYKYQNGQLYIICNQLSVKAKNIENDLKWKRRVSFDDLVKRMIDKDLELVQNFNHS